jgi:glycosyltransferase involved in cell wall biosynthesis
MAPVERGAPDPGAVTVVRCQAECDRRAEMDLASVSVIVPARNVEDKIARQLDALAREIASIDGEIVVIDDASNDTTAQEVAAWMIENPAISLTLLRAKRRRGVCGSRNAGLMAASKSLVAFADGDDVVDGGWLAGLLSVQGPGRICGGAVREPNGPERLPAGFGLPYAFGGCMLMEKRLALRVLGFDEQIRLGGTEVDFAIRAQLFAGAEVVNTPAAVTSYWVPTPSGKRLWRDFRRERGHAYVVQRHRAQVDFGSRTQLPWRSVAGNLLRVVHSTDCGLSTRLRNLARSLSQLLWMVRFRFHLPAPRLLNKEVLRRYRVGSCNDC